ncbi:MAG: hypothetical protein ABIQ70_13225 [Dokdonella sp.]
MNPTPARPRSLWLLIPAFLMACLVYWPGLYGSWFFDDYPNIVDNADVQPQRLGFSEIVNAALSSPASDLKRPLASLSFVANYTLDGLDPFGWKLANLALHLLNGLLLFLLARKLFAASSTYNRPIARVDLTAVAIAAAWMLLPINLTAVLLVVQRMESMANLFVLLGLLGYVHGRQRMLQPGTHCGVGLCIASLILPTAVGVMAKESAVMLPLYALLIEWIVFGFRRAATGGAIDRRLVALFACVLALPAVAGLAWLVPGLLRTGTWTTRDFTLGTRLLSESRIIVDYIGWTLLPTPQSLSFYHDDFAISQNLSSPWTTLASIAAIGALLATAVHWRTRQPLVALGIALYFGGHLLTGTILPLELVYEHRNYFPSFGLLLATVPLLVAPTPALAFARHALLCVLLVWWTGITALTARAWGEPLRLATELAVRAPQSPRAQFGLGYELLRHSGYDPASPLLAQGYASLQRASLMPASSLLPEQTMILTASLMHRPVDQRWWDRLIEKLEARVPDAQAVSALGALTRCVRNHDCDLPRERMLAAFEAAQMHARADARVLAIYSDYAWNVLEDRELGKRLAEAEVTAQPGNVDARISLARMNIVLGRPDKAREQVQALERLNWSGGLDKAIAELQGLIEARMPTKPLP